VKLDVTLERIRAANPASPVATENVALFDAIVASPGDQRLLVRRSSWRRVSARVALVAAVVVLAAVVTAVAFDWPQRVVAFFSSARAPARVVHAFATFSFGAPPGVDRQVRADEARTIMTVRINGNLTTLYVAPTKSGGFCYAWSDLSLDGCVGAGERLGHGAGPLGVLLNRAAVVGWVRLGATRALEARFADATTATIPVTWVSAPINAGFVAYLVPRSHRDRAHALRSVVALDADGRVIGRVSAPPTPPKPPPWVPHRLPDGTLHLFPPGAEVAKARKIISFSETNGSRVYLWLVPLAHGGHCFISNGAHGLGQPPSICATGLLSPIEPTSSSPPHSNSVFVGGLESQLLIFLGVAKPAVATVELRYQNGERERLTPIDGFVLHQLGPAHWKRGTRLVAAVALNRNGKALSTERFLHPDAPGWYP
jgi:hypothetical protein